MLVGVVLTSVAANADDGGRMYIIGGAIPYDGNLDMAQCLMSTSEAPSTYTGTLYLRFISLTDTTYESGVGLGSPGSFLCDRLTQYVIKVPSLRECQEDILPPANFFLERYSQEYPLEVKGFDEKAVGKLPGYPWTGNVITAKELNFDNLRDTFLERIEETSTRKRRKEQPLHNNIIRAV